LPRAFYHRKYQPTRIGRLLFNQAEVELADQIASRDKSRVEPGGFECAPEK